jgi:hypothetical protein
MLMIRLACPWMIEHHHLGRDLERRSHSTSRSRNSMTCKEPMQEESLVSVMARVGKWRAEADAGGI